MPSARMHWTYLRTAATYWVTTSALAEPVGEPDAAGPPVPAALATLGVSASGPQPASSTSDAAVRTNHRFITRKCAGGADSYTEPQRRHVGHDRRLCRRHK